MGGNSQMGSSLTGAGPITNDQLDSIHHKISIPPKILCPSSAKPSCCIFRVPRSFVETNGRAYHPRIVSLGPYHLGHPDLSMIQEHKYRYLGAVLSRCPLSLESLIRSLEPLIEPAIQCYSESISLSTDEFLEMLVVDSVFLIELFMRSYELVPRTDDPIFTMLWVFPFFCRDFLCLENQIPYFVLKKIYNEVTRTAAVVTLYPNFCISPVPSLARLALTFFNKCMNLPWKETVSCDNLHRQHLLDLVRATFLPRNAALGELPDPGVPIRRIPCVSKLRRSGIHLRATKRKETETFLAVRFREERGWLEMPTIRIDDLMAGFLVNCIAFEQCFCGTTTHFTEYMSLLDCLVNTARDVEYMCDHGIIEGSLGTDEDVAKLINNMMKDVTIRTYQNYLLSLFIAVQKYYKNSWHIQWAGFKYTYFNTTWSFISALAALVLLLATVTQTFFTTFAYYLPRSSQERFFFSGNSSGF